MASAHQVCDCKIFLLICGFRLDGRRVREKRRPLAEWLLAAGFEHDHERKLIKRVISLYESWHAAEPGKGYDAKAAEWRARLPEAE